MGLTVDQAKDLIRFARDAGLRRLRFGDLEIEFGAPVPNVEALKEEKPKTSEQILEQLRKEEDDLLFASAGA